ncbi:MAG: 2-oxo acid dehydrogenase subunit E2 [Nitrososphaerota archaeon]|jgi:pyruvate dehydrogenase E2 component (dihydrolipoamide acetyltransferase)|uniref:2-oxo acid dehydrogenase subunit E2 n=1 Tax=Candidatus Bathycorpusculum sp. TaxID=2994959 RepID=UPI002818D717|nr:2-oxo acid dehydrogenase subunit E2 [Candidatus Termitimicrobium sp.]MDR0492079.1 2-oxo acid dehydrogenase subunit E2 [Nitrososphaerota archaeon]
MGKELNLLQKAISYKTTESWTTIPHITFIYEADATEILNKFGKLNEKNQDLKLTINTLLLKICTEAIKTAPQVNAHIKYNSKRIAGKIEVIKNINISMPWLLENNEIVVINLRNFEDKTLVEMQEYINKIAQKINNCNIHIPLYRVSVSIMIEEMKKGHLLRATYALLGAAFDKTKPNKKDIKEYDKIPIKDKIIPPDLQPGTITISNLGSVCKGLNGFMGILEVIPPQVFAIGIGSIQEKPCVIKNENNEKFIAIRKVIPICLGFDHRALNFGDIVPFIQKMEHIFEHSELLKEWY